MRALLLALTLYLPLVMMPGTTLEPGPTPFPTPIEPAEEFTFTDVGQEQVLMSHVDPWQPIGKVLVAGLQTIIIKDFHYNGPFPASIVLTKANFLHLLCNPSYELWSITGTQQGTFILVHQPAKLRHEDVDTIVVCAGGEAVASTGAFPPPREYDPR